LHLHQLQAVDAPDVWASCEPWKLKGILVLWHFWRYRHAELGISTKGSNKKLSWCWQPARCV